jgi:hypothetical protein
MATRPSAPPLDLGLPALQRWMQAVIEQPGSVDDAVVSPAAAALLDPAEVSRVVRPSATLTSVERVGVYQGMYLLRMVEALQSDYPAVAHFLGDDEFAELVTRYCEAHPSKSYTLNRLGDRFPEFVAASRGLRRRAFLADLARLELAVTAVFDAPETPALTPDAIAAVREEEWPDAVLEPIAALRALSFAHPVNAYLQSVKDDDHDHPSSARKASRVVVWRKSYEVWRLDVAEKPFALLRALIQGQPFGKAVARAAKGLEGVGAEPIYRWLRDWVAEGMFARIRTS